MRNIRPGDIVRIDLTSLDDEDLISWVEPMMIPEDVDAIWERDLTCAIVEDAGRDWVNLILYDGRLVTNLDIRRVKLISAL